MHAVSRELGKRNSLRWLRSEITIFITQGAKLLNTDWLRRRAFFLNHGSTFADWLRTSASWVGSYVPLQTCFKRMLNRNFRNASLLCLIWSRLFHCNVNENWHAAKRSLFVKKANRFFRPKLYWFAACWPEKKFDWGLVVSHERYGRKKTERKFLRLASGALLVSQVTLSEKTRQQKFCWYVNFSQWKGEFWIQDVIRVHLDTCLLLTSSREAAWPSG